MSTDLNEARIAKLRAEARKMEAEAQEIEARQSNESTHNTRFRFEWIKYVIAGLVAVPGIFVLAQQAFVPMLNSKQERIEAVEDQVLLVEKRLERVRGAAQASVEDAKKSVDETIKQIDTILAESTLTTEQKKRLEDTSQDLVVSAETLRQVGTEIEHPVSTHSDLLNSGHAWIYVGKYKNDQWSGSPTIKLKANQLPIENHEYVVATTAVNVRESRPKAPFYRLPTRVDQLTKNERVKVLEVVKVGFGKIWVRVQAVGERGT